MIEVNLLPGGRKRSGGGGKFSFTLPKLGAGGLGAIRLPKGDPWTLGAAAAVIVVLLGVGWLYLGVAGEAEEIQVQVEAAQSDSVRFADIIRRSAGIQARRDTIAQRVSVIQEIDGARYVWPHILDEVGRALPDYVWFTRLVQLEAGENIVIQIDGRAGNYFALTSLVENLEASPYLEQVEPISSGQIVEESESGVTQTVIEFIIEAVTVRPPLELIETVPLFEGASAPPAGGA